MTNHCIFCLCSNEELIIIPPYWVEILQLDSDLVHCCCNDCGNRKGIFCVKDHDCYSRYLGESFYFCQECYWYYLSIALLSPKSVAKLFIKVLRYQVGRVEECRFRASVRQKKQRLYQQSALLCAYNAACGHVEAQSIIMGLLPAPYPEPTFFVFTTQDALPTCLN